ncbi:MAG: Cna B-type domain-containing protein, partial [Clostridiales bacterium]|nr:Cna B-type domain-containing protein [Clostridiales bacterium]
MKTSISKRWRKLGTLVLIAALLIFNVPLTAFAAGIDTFQQFANTDLEWINGNVNQNKSHYVEGMANPQRAIVRGLTNVSQSITFAYQFTKGGQYAYDFVTSWDQAMDLADHVGGQTWQDSWKWIGTDQAFWTAPTASHYSVGIPDSDPHATPDRIATFEGALGYGNRTIDIYANGTLINPRITIDSTLYGSTASDSQVYWTLLWDGGTATDIMVLYAGHIAIGLDFPSTNIGWGSGMGAGGISGSPYHQMIKAATEFTPGSQDNQMSAAAIDLKSGISGYKWHDEDADGVWDADEDPLSGWTIWVDYNSDGIPDATDVTDSNGFYELYFTLPSQSATSVRVYENLQAGWRQTYPAAGYHETTVTPGYATEDINFGNTERLVDKTVRKVWNDGDNQDGLRPASVSVQLKANGTDVGSPVTLNAGNSWSHTWTGLPEYSGGVLINYTIVESPVPTGYSAGYSIDDGEFVVTNTHVPETTSVSVRKVWNDGDNQDGIRPASVSVQLKANGSNVGSPVTLDADNSWSHTWTGLPKYAGTTTPIAYTVVETPVPAGYTVGYSTDETGHVITNTHVPETTSVSVRKVWNDGDNQDGIRPASVSVQLKEDGVAVGAPVTLDADNSWSHTWTGLPKYAGTTTPIVYTVEETPVPAGYTVGYSTDETGHVITNTHVPETTSVSVRKVWNDADNQDGIRPASVSVQLKAGGIAVGSPVTLDADNSWSHTWTGLPKYAGT